MGSIAKENRSPKCTGIGDTHTYHGKSVFLVHGGFSSMGTVARTRQALGKRASEQGADCLHVLWKYATLLTAHSFVLYLFRQ